MVHAWVVVAVGAGEGDALRERDGAVAADHELHAVGVELGAADGVLVVARVGLVQGDQLGAKEVSFFPRLLC